MQKKKEVVDKHIEQGIVILITGNGKGKSTCIAGKNPVNPDRQVRLACRDVFRTTNLLEKIIPTTEYVLAAGEISTPPMPPESVPPEIPNPESLGNDGQRAR